MPEENTNIKKYINYHCHDTMSNLATSDSVVSYNDYAERIIELGYGTLMSVAHGSQGHYLECYEIAKKANIPFRFGTEAYWVMDAKEKDRTNNHIIILAKNMNGIKAINRALSYANIDGFFYRPRLGIDDILSLPKDDVFITTACVGFGGYGETGTEIAISKIHERFGSNFMIEVQYHHTPKQVEWNKFMLKMADKYGIEIIAGIDSHYIGTESCKDRDLYIKSKGIRYEDEEGWFLDFPSYDVAYERFVKQGVLSEEQIATALNNTNLISEFEDVTFDDGIKLPNIFPELTYEQREEHLKEIINNAWMKEKEKVPKDRHEEYVTEIKKELDIVFETKMTDYFILNYYVVKRAKELGGRLTLTSRGSAPSFYINMLLGFTTIDRISSPIQLFPERFMSVSRILETKSLPDIDFNVICPNPFIEAQRELLGEHSTYYMIAHGKLKHKSAFKMYAKANDVEFSISNKISKQIERYEAESINNNTILNIEDYVDKEYINMVKESEKYLGIIDSASPHSCALVSYSGNVLEDIGVIRLKGNIVTVINGKYLEKYKYVKNDFLVVSVVDIIYNVFDEVGIEPLTSTQLLNVTQDDSKVWDMFKHGHTIGLNQVEQPGTRNKCMEYEPTNISELSAFVASIRPGFASMFDRFIKREDFEYDIPEFDKLIQTEQMKDTWLLYQEQIMQTLQYAGFSSDETYGLIKAIAKKVEGVVDLVKDKFIKGFMQKGNTIQDAETVWKVIEDNSRYSFNSSHSLSVALDSLYGAYLKAYYPYEFYKVMLVLYTEKKDIKKISSIKKEMKEFGIKIGDLKLGLDNTGFVIDKKNSSINQSLKTVKYINSKIANELKDVPILDKFYEVLYELKYTSANTRQIETLIKIGYFDRYGGIGKLLMYYKLFIEIDKKGTFNKELDKEILFLIKDFAQSTNKTYRNVDKQLAMEKLDSFLKEYNDNPLDLIKNEIELLGYVRTDIPKNINIALVEISASKSGWVKMIGARSSAEIWCMCDSRMPIVGKYIQVKSIKKQFSKKYYREINILSSYNQL